MKILHWTFHRVVVAALATLLVAGCDPPKYSDRPLRPGQVLEFGRLYVQNCAGCHGADGRLGPAPPLNDSLFLAIIPDSELRRVITEGRAGTPMSAFARANGGALTPEQVDSLVSGIRSKWGGASTQPAQSLPAYIASATGNASAGTAVFERTCAACHGPNGVGPSKAGPVNVPAFLALITDQALRRIVITGRSDLGMPDYRHVADGSPHPAALSPAEIDDVVALLASWRQAPVAPKQMADATGVER